MLLCYYCVSNVDASEEQKVWGPYDKNLKINMKKLYFIFGQGQCSNY